MKLYGEILILVLMILSNGRVLTIRKAHLDPLVMLAPLSFFLAILSLFAFTVDSFLILIFLLSVFVLLSNFHALIRYGSHLVIDRYSLLMKIWAWFTTLISICLLALILYFRPVNVSERTHNVSVTKENYSGNFTGGFFLSEKLTPSTAFLTEFKKSDSEKKDNRIFILLPDKRGDTENYFPFLVYLAKEDFTAVSFDFYTKDLKLLHTFEDSRIFRKLGMNFRSFLNNQKFKSQREFYTFNYSRELDAITKICLNKYGQDTTFFIITDEMGITAAQDYAAENPALISGLFNLSTVDEYKTPGYGFIQQTNPLLAKLLGFNRDKENLAISACVKAVINETEQ